MRGAMVVCHTVVRRREVQCMGCEKHPQTWQFMACRAVVVGLKAPRERQKR